MTGDQAVVALVYTLWIYGGLGIAGSIILLVWLAIANRRARLDAKRRSERSACQRADHI